MLWSFVKSVMRRSALCVRRLVSVLFTALALIPIPPRAEAGTVDLFQARNGTAASPRNPVEWVKGNAGPANSHYLEGFSIPYRVVFTDLEPGPHYLVLEWDTRQAGKHAIDYLTHYERLQPHNQFGGHTAESVRPLDGLADVFGAPATFPIPVPSSVGSPTPGQPAASFNALSAAERSITIWNATITEAVYLQETGLNNAAASSQLRIDFVADQPTVVVALGGHIASPNDWGVGNSATSIAGSPYHLRLVSFDGSGGNQDRSVQALAVIALPVITCEPNRTVEYGLPWDFEAPTATGVCGDGEVVISVAGTVTNQLIGKLFSATRTWTVTDACGNTATCSQMITLVDTTRPEIVCPANITSLCAGRAGTGISFTAAATDIGEASPLVTCNPPSGSIFSLGVTTVSCVAFDASGNQSECGFTVTVADPLPPEIVCPASFAVLEDPAGEGMALISYPAPSASDNCDASPQIVCDPPSGSILPVGEHLVNCTATDGSANATSCSFTIQVVPRVIIANNLADSGPGTLRQALLDANAAPGTNVIQFAFPGNSPHSIHLLSPLPPLGDVVIIDGWSQLQFTGLPVIELDGTNVVVPPPEPGTSASGPKVGLVITAGGTLVRGLTLNGFDVGLSLEGLGGNIIQGNLIGLDSSGIHAMANAGDGIRVLSPGNQIGGSSPAERNVISGNLGSGICLVGTRATGNVLWGNLIGTAADKTSPVGNRENGVRISAGAAANIIGGSRPGEGNVIAFNGGSGVLLDPDAGTGNRVEGNAIFANGGLGIDLGGDGATDNDEGDVDEGPNGLQNAPVLTLARSLGGTTTVAGVLAGTPNTAYLVEFFLNTAADESGLGVTQLSMGRATITTDATGHADLSASFAISATAFQFVTATATDPGNNTSEFALVVPVGTPPVILTHPVGDRVEVGASVSFCVTAIGSQPLLYQWRLNGANIPAATNRCLEIPSVQLQNGGTYTVVVANDLGIVVSESARLSLIFGDGVVGDDFVDRVRLVAANGIKSGNNSVASLESGEPLHGGKPGGKSIWYTWTPPGKGIATFSTAGSGFDTLLAVYSGSNLVSLLPEASDEDTAGFYTSGRSFNVFDGMTYHIAIDGFGGASGDFVISWTFEPTRDQLPVITNQPVSITVASGATAVFNVGAFGTCRSIEHDCRHVGKDTHPQQPDPQRVVTYQWYFNGMILPGATRSTLTVSNVQENLVGLYYAIVETDGRTQQSDVVSLQINETDQFVQNVQARDKFLNAALGPPLRLGGVGSSPPNGNFEPASTVVRGYTGTQVFNTAGSSTEAGEEPICDVVGGASQWIAFVAQETGMVFFNTDGSSYDTVMAVFARMTNSPMLQYLDCDNDGGLDGRDSALVIPVQAGRTNFIVIDGVNGATGVLRLNYNLVTPTLLVPMGTTAEGNSRVRVSGRPNQRFTLQRSTNFQNWSSLITTNAVSGVFDFIDTGSAVLPGKYYRALLLP
jgi:hypothetical protein